MTSSLLGLLCFFNSSHHHDKLLKLDLTVAVLINLPDDGVDSFGREGICSTEAQDFSNLLSRDDTRAVLVEHAEGSVELLLRSKVALASSSNYELRVVNEARVVGIDRLEHRLDFLVRHDSTIVLKITLLDFLHRELTISILVEGLEHLGEVVALGLTHKLGGDERVSGLLEGHITIELSEVIKGAQSEIFINLGLSQLSEPYVQ